MKKDKNEELKDNIEIKEKNETKEKNEVKEKNEKKDIPVIKNKVAPIKRKKIITKNPEIEEKDK